MPEINSLVMLWINVLLSQKLFVFFFCYNEISYLAQPKRFGWRMYKKMLVENVLLGIKI